MWRRSDTRSCTIYILYRYITKRISDLSDEKDINLDVNNDGVITLADLWTLLTSLLDENDEDEPLSKTEYYAFLHDLGLKINANMMERMFAFADQNGNGSIETEELNASW